MNEMRGCFLNTVGFFFWGFFNFQYLFIYNINKLDGGKTSTEAPRFSPQQGCQGLPGLDSNEILIDRSKYSYIAVSIIEYNSTE